MSKAPTPIVAPSASPAEPADDLLRQFGEASSDVLWIRDAGTMQWVYLTPAFETVYGVPREQVLAGDSLRNWLDLMVPEDRAPALAKLEQARAGERVAFEYRIRRPSGEERWLHNIDFPIRGREGEVVRIGGVCEDITAAKAAEAALADGERWTRVLLEGIPQLVWRSRDKGDWTWSGPQWRDFTGQTLEESLGLGWLDAVHSDDRPAASAAWEVASAQGGLDVEFRVRRATDGAYVWHHTRSTPVRDADGRIVEWLGTCTDVQRLKEYQERQAVMVAELQHRTRNLIAVIRSIADQTLEMTGPGPEFADRFGERMAALSRVQGFLSRSDDEPITLEALIRSELDALNAGDQVALSGPVVRLRSKVVQTLALAIHELATNARKHGGLLELEGRLEIGWQTIEDEGNPRLKVDWVEHAGRPLPSGGAVRGGYGRQLIERALPYALGARTSFTLTEDGVRCTIDLPFDRVGKRNR